MECLPLSRRRSSSRNVPSDEERGETDVFAGYMIARHAKDFTRNRGCSSNPPPLKHGDQIPHPLEDSDNQIPSSPGRQRCQMPGVCPGGGGGMLKLRFDRYIKVNIPMRAALPAIPMDLRAASAPSLPAAAAALEPAFAHLPK